MNTLYTNNSMIPKTSSKLPLHGPNFCTSNKIPKLETKCLLNKRSLANPSNAAAASALGLGIIAIVVVITLVGIGYQIWYPPVITIQVDRYDPRSIVELSELARFGQRFNLIIVTYEIDLGAFPHLVRLLREPFEAYTYTLPTDLGLIHLNITTLHSQFMIVLQQYYNDMLVVNVHSDLDWLREVETQLKINLRLSDAKRKLCLIRTLEGVIRHFDPTYTSRIGVCFGEDL